MEPSLCCTYSLLVSVRLSIVQSLDIIFKCFIQKSLLRKYQICRINRHVTCSYILDDNYRHYTILTTQNVMMLDTTKPCYEELFKT